MKHSLVLALLIPSSIFACLQIEGTSMDGHRKSVIGGRAVRLLRQAMSENPRTETAGAKFGAPKTEFQKQEAEAVNRILSGDFDTAIARLLAMEEKSPGHYTTAANLGTAYELRGDNANALKWITKGIQINPESHHGTEWLHALILEMKLEGANHPERPIASRILDVPERMKADTPIPLRGNSYSALKLRHALFLQLSERMVFVKPKDPYVADLLYSFALIEANLSSVEAGLGLLKMAREYGFTDEPLLNLREQQYESLVRIALIKKWGMATLVTSGIVLFFYYGYRRKWFFLTKRARDAHREALTKTQGLSV